MLQLRNLCSKMVLERPVDRGQKTLHLYRMEPKHVLLVLSFKYVVQTGSGKVKTRRKVIFTARLSSELLSNKTLQIDSALNREKSSLICSFRLFIAVLVLLCTCIQYSQKIDLSVNIICMVNHTALRLSQPGNVSAVKKHHAKLDGPFVWPKKIQGLILSMFFWGYLIAQIPAGILARKYGAKWVMTIAMVVNGVCLMLYKTAAKCHYGVLMFLRLIVGIGAGVIFPSVSQIWTKWAPKADRSFLIGLAVSGSHLGSVFTLPLGGYLCVRGFDGGWPSLFYTIGILTFIWIGLWLVFYTNTPKENRFISEGEKIYILENVPKTTTRKAVHQRFLVHTLMNWGFYTLLTCTPTYMSEVLHFDIKSNGGLSAIPYILIWIFTTTSSYVADVCIQKKWLSRTNTRKLANLIGSLIPAAFLIGLGFITENQPYVAVILLAAGQAAFGVAFGAGFLCVCNDMSPKYASIIFGISNMFGTLPGIISPYVTSVMTRNQTLKEWRKVFILAAILWIIGGVEFAIFGKADPQPFDEDVKADDIEEAKELKPR